MLANKVPLPANRMYNQSPTFHDYNESKSTIVQVEFALVFKEIQRCIHAKPVPFCLSPAARKVQGRSADCACPAEKLDWFQECTGK